MNLMKTITIFILFFTLNFGYSQKNQCSISFNQIEKIFKLYSYEVIDNELKKLNYIFNFNSNSTVLKLMKNLISTELTSIIRKMINILYLVK